MNDYLPLKLRDLEIENKQTQRRKAITFLGIMLDENVNWQEYIRPVENKIAKNIEFISTAQSIC